MLATLVLLSCGDQSTAPQSARLVIEAFLVTDEPIQNIRITETLPLSSTDSLGVAIDHATVRLIRGADSYELELMPAASGLYWLPDGSITVQPGEALTLNIAYEGEVVSGSTIAPSQPSLVQLSSDTLVVNDSTIENNEDNILFVWQPAKQSDTLFFLTIESVDPGANTLIYNGIGIVGPKKTSTFPVSGNSFMLRGGDFFFDGRHMVRIIAVNEEYVALKDDQVQTGNDLSQAPSNIENGEGIFTVLAPSDSIFLTVYQE